MDCKKLGLMWGEAWWNLKEDVVGVKILWGQAFGWE